jgi:hypothetical protein
MTFKTMALMASAVLLSACSAMTTISSPNAGTTVALRDKTLALPATQSIKGTTFGNYEFKATDPASQEAMYGILPLEMKGGHMAADILLFAPGMFFNLRGAFPFYEVDVRNGVIRYKEDKDDAWVEYRPTPEEAARAREFFNPKQGGGAATGR